jgi:hypothetical protein
MLRQHVSKLGPPALQHEGSPTVEVDMSQHCWKVFVPAQHAAGPGVTTPAPQRPQDSSHSSPTVVPLGKVWLQRKPFTPRYRAQVVLEAPLSHCAEAVDSPRATTLHHSTQRTILSVGTPSKELYSAAPRVQSWIRRQCLPGLLSFPRTPPHRGAAPPTVAAALPCNATNCGRCGSPRHHLWPLAVRRWICSSRSCPAPPTVAAGTTPAADQATVV